MDSFTISFKNQNRIINNEVEITSLGFRPTPDKRTLQGFPRRMVWSNREYTFAEQGMQYLVRKGQHLVRLFDVRDSQGTTYRLRQEDNRWTLVTIKSTGALA